MDPMAAQVDEFGPQRLFQYYDSRVPMHAVVVIDTLRFGMTAGGVRMLPDISLTEMIRLARAMTYKFAMLELPIGGAKAGIWADPQAGNRDAVMAAFLRAIEPLTSAGTYFPGGDMGTASADFAALYARAGNVQDLGSQPYDGMLLEDQLTGYGVVAAARAAVEFDGGRLADMRVAIEGFGKVGGGAAKFFARDAARVVAVSTLRGTLYDQTGLDVTQLLELRARHGDAVVERYPHGRLLGREVLFALPVDILVPGARPDAINAGNVGPVSARYIVPAANIPYADGTVAGLHARGSVVVPDFVSNAGGVLAGVVGLRGGSAEEAFATVRERIEHNVRRVRARATAERRDPVSVAIDIARERLRDASGL